MLLILFPVPPLRSLGDGGGEWWCGGYVGGGASGGGSDDGDDGDLSPVSTRLVGVSTHGNIPARI